MNQRATGSKPLVTIGEFLYLGGRTAGVLVGQLVQKAPSVGARCVVWLTLPEMSGPDLAIYDDIIAAFRLARCPQGIDGIQYAKAAKKIAPLYERIFGKGMVANHLMNDLTGHGDGLIDAVLADPTSYRYVELMVPEMVKRKGLENIRGKFGEGVIECLWTTRALNFILTFMDYGIFQHTDLTLYDCASKAYKETLKPYHGIMVAGIVSLAFNLTPRRDQFLHALGFTELEAAQRKLAEFKSVVRPVICQVSETLERHGCNFPDKV